MVMLAANSLGLEVAVKSIVGNGFYHNKTFKYKNADTTRDDSWKMFF